MFLFWFYCCFICANKKNKEKYQIGNEWKMLKSRSRQKFQVYSQKLLLLLLLSSTSSSSSSSVYVFISFMMHKRTASYHQTDWGSSSSIYYLCITTCFQFSKCEILSGIESRPFFCISSLPFSSRYQKISFFFFCSNDFFLFLLRFDMKTSKTQKKTQKKSKKKINKIIKGGTNPLTTL